MIKIEQFELTEDEFFKHMLTVKDLQHRQVLKLVAFPILYGNDPNAKIRIPDMTSYMKKEL